MGYTENTKPGMRFASKYAGLSALRSCPFYSTFQLVGLYHHKD